MRGRMVATSGVASAVIDFGLDAIAGSQPTRSLHAMSTRAAWHEPNHAPDGRARPSITKKLTAIRHLAARFDIKRRPVQHDVAVSASRKFLDLSAVLVEHGLDLGVFDVSCRIPKELIWQTLEPLLLLVRLILERHSLFRLEGAAGARALALRLHRLFERILIDAQSTLLGQVLGEVERHAQGVVETEHFLAGDDLRSRLDRAIQQF